MGRREEVEDDLVSLIREKGFARLSVDRMADELHCSKSTLYALGRNREEIVKTAINRYFRQATDRAEAAAASAASASEAIGRYLGQIGADLQTSDEFLRDLTTHPYARHAYELNTRAAARRVKELAAMSVDDGPDDVGFDVFLAEAARAVIVHLHAGGFRAASVSDAEAFRRLGELLTAALRGHPARPTVGGRAP